MHKVLFEDTEEGKKRYEMCYQAIAMVPRDYSIPQTKWDDVIGLVKKLKSVGEESETMLGSHHLYDLQEGGGEIMLERSEMKLLVELVGLPIWRPLAIEDAQNLKKWLEAVPKEKGSLKLDAPPHKRRAAGESNKE